MAIPAELCRLPQWVAATAAKVPICPRTGQAASVTDPSTWGTYEQAVAHASATGLPHVGFVLTESDPYVFIDLDEPETPEQAVRHNKILAAFDTYTEVSQSGRGLHIIARGRVPRGARRDRVELYWSGRYMICTGAVYRDAPINDCQPLIDLLFQQISKPAAAPTTGVEQAEGGISDRELFERAMRAANADKFDALCRGEWQGDYPSQSEADYALLSILTFYTRDDAQVMRLFRYSALGRRDKAKRDDYLRSSIRRIRENEPPPIDFSALRLAIPPDQALPEAPAIVAPQLSPPPRIAVAAPATEDDGYPPGLVGDLARYIYATSSRPVREISIAAALALAAGIVGRQYNISGTGLNLYIILLAKTGVGKEGASSGISRLIGAVRPSVPMVDQFVGPGAFASGQAIIRTLDQQPGFVSVLGEFGLTLQTLSSESASGNNLILRRVLLDLYGKSGHSSVLYSSAYADKERNTKTLYSPALTLLGESTPETFYAGLSIQHIADGLIPRFLIIEYEGDRPERNPDAFAVPGRALADRLAELASIVLQAQANQTWLEVAMDDEARELLDAFDRECDDLVNNGSNEGERQLWNRAHLKAIRVAGVLAAADRPTIPVIERADAEWAIALVRNDAGAMARRVDAGDIGEGEVKQNADLQRIIDEYVTRPAADLAGYGVPRAMHAARVIPHSYLARRTASLAAYRKYRGGARAALREAIDDQIKAGRLQEIRKEQMQELFGTRAAAYRMEIY